MAGKNTIGSKIVIEGEKEYNESLRRIRTEQQELRSEMNLCTETYKENANTVEALRQKQEILAKQVDAQSRKVESQRKVLESANKAQEEAKKRIEQYQEALSKAEKELDRMESAADTSAEAIEAQKKEIEDLNSKLILSQQGYDKAEAAAVKYQTALNNAEADLLKLENELDRTNGYLGEAEESADGCAKSIDNYGRQVKEAGEESQKFKEKAVNGVNALASALVASGIAKGVKEIAYALMDCSDKAKNFETSMNKVYTIADENAVAQAEMSAQLLQTSTEMIQSVNDMADAAYNAISAGVDTADAVGFAATSTKLAVGGFTDATTAVDILTTAVNAYNLETEKSVEISDMLVTTQNEGKTTVGELGANMGKVIPLAAAYNVNMANLSATYAKLTANGIKTAESTTYIKAMLNELGDSGSAVSKILMEETGYSFAELMEQGYSLGDVISLLGESVDGNTGAFNELWSSSEAGIGALSLLGTGAEEFNRVLAKMENSAGATETAFKKMTDSTEYAEKRMENAIENLKIAIGNTLNPALKDMYNGGADAFEWATDFVREHPEVVKGIAIVAAGVGALTVAVVGLTAAVAAFNAIMEATNPIILAISTALGVLAAGYAAISEATAHRETELEKEIAKTKELAAAQRECMDSMLDEAESNSKNIQQVRELALAIDQMNKKENLSAGEKSELAAQVSILNELMPELNLAINEQTGYLEDSTGAFAEYARELANVREYENILEQNKNTYQARLEAENQLTEAIRQQEEAYAALQKTKEENAVVDFFGVTVYQNISDVNAAEQAYIDASYAVGEYRQIIADAEIELQNMSEYLEAARVSLEETNTVQIEYKGATYEVSQSVSSNINDIQTAYEQARDAAEESIKSQVGLFDEISVQSNLTTAEMAANLQSQTDTFNQYKNDLLAASELVERGLLDEGLLGSIQELGMNGAGYLHELVEASKTDVESYAAVVASYQEMIDARASLSDAIGDLAENYTSQMDSLLGIQTEKYGQMEETTETTYANIQASLEEAMASMVATQANGIDEMVACVSEKYPEMGTAAAGLCEAAEKGLLGSLVVVDDGSSEVFRDIGYKIPESVAQGIRDGQEVVSGAVQEVIDNAIASADLSGISAEIDRQLGIAFQ